MTRIILTCGIIAGAIVIAAIVLGMQLGAESSTGGMLLGYAIMLVAFSMIFIGVKRYRDQQLGGVIRFGPAFALGLGIAAVAALVYVIGWEITLAATDYRFMDDYSRSMLEEARAGGASPAELAAKRTELAAMQESYRNPLFRVAITFSEIFPVGLVVALVSAALLRNSRLLPARVRA